MVSIEYMRNALLNLYKSDRWARRVRHMPDGQVTAIYMKEFAEPKKPKDEKEPPQDETPF